MVAKIGDRIIVESERVGVPSRIGEIIGIVPHEPRTEFLVRWDDGHESSIRPSAGSYRVVETPVPATTTGAPR